MSKPYITKHDNAWRVYINGHMYASRATHADAWAFAENVATYARRIRLRLDIARIKKSLSRMEGRPT